MPLGNAGGAPGGGGGAEKTGGAFGGKCIAPRTKQIETHIGYGADDGIDPKPTNSLTIHRQLAHS